MVVIDGVEMLEVREAASLARRTPETIRRWVWAGRLPAHRLGNRWLLRRSDIEALTAPERRPTARASSLAEWAELLATARSSGTTAPQPGASAADLVLEDRRARNGDELAS